jgi:hypothetical protein
MVGVSQHSRDALPSHAYLVFRLIHFVPPFFEGHDLVVSRVLTKG